LPGPPPKPANAPPLFAPKKAVARRSKFVGRKWSAVSTSQAAQQDRNKARIQVNRRAGSLSGKSRKWSCQRINGPRNHSRHGSGERAKFGYDRCRIFVERCIRQIHLGQDLYRDDYHEHGNQYHGGPWLDSPPQHIAEIYLTFVPVSMARTCYLYRTRHILFQRFRPDYRLLNTY